MAINQLMKRIILSIELFDLQTAEKSEQFKSGFLAGLDNCTHIILSLHSNMFKQILNNIKNDVLELPAWLKHGIRNLRKLSNQDKPRAFK